MKIIGIMKEKRSPKQTIIAIIPLSKENIYTRGTIKQIEFLIGAHQTHKIMRKINKEAYNHALKVKKLYEEQNPDFLSTLPEEKETGWIASSDRLPKKDESERYTQNLCLCRKRYQWKNEKKEGSGIYFTIQLLQFNHTEQRWDNEDGDDYNCDIDSVTHWMPLPEFNPSK
jgi:hypothetical protein